MGKIMVVGKAERDYEADRCTIQLNISTIRDTAAEASSVSGEQCELLLSKLQDAGISPDQAEIREDAIDARIIYRQDTELTRYESRKCLRLFTEADMKTVNAIRGIIEEGFENVSFSTAYSVSNEAELNKELLTEAIADAREKAELLAGSMGHRIIGVDTANLSGEDDVYDMTLNDEQPAVMYGMAKNSRALTDQLKPGRITLNARVKITWLLDE